MAIFKHVFLVLALAASTLAKKKLDPEYMHPLVAGAMMGAGYNLAIWNKRVNSAEAFAKKKVMSAESWDRYFRENNIREVTDKAEVELDRLVQNFKNYRGDMFGQLSQIKNTLRTYLEKFNNSVDAKVKDPTKIGAERRRARKMRQLRRQQMIEKYRQVALKKVPSPGTQKLKIEHNVRVGPHKMLV